MENRKRQLKAHRRNVVRKNTSHHGRSTKLQNLELSNYSPSIKIQHNRGPLTSSSSSNSSSMKAFIFNTDTLGRNQYFPSLPRESTDRRIVKYHNTPRTLLLKSPSLNKLIQSTFILGGVNSNLNLNEIHICDRTTSECIQYLKNFSGNTSPSDRDIIFGNARKLLKQTCGWENSRIQWLLDLERRQEMRRTKEQCYEEDLMEMICCFPLNLNMLT
ncbi:uncharacterized protein LOC129914160 [Episyrphus balteatus]|uniref:uncharacterized protein LOC129914160 n=1 Tax=Episyrphus balteatus TaxID=286459 RepID=UPI0024850BAC|nr:uncharacterized protein LOC129914160 [Episyrphus balteatus]